MIPPKIQDGMYVPPDQAFKNDCVPPPPGEWPPAQPAPAGKVWCPPQGYAPPPMHGDDFRAWENFTKDHAPPSFTGYLNQLGGGWNKFNESALADISNASTAHQLFAPPSFDGRSMNGSFVKSDFDAGLGVRNFSVGGARFFSEAGPQFNANSSFSTTAGPTVLSSGDGVIVESHNVPSGLLAYKSDGNRSFNVSFTPEAGYNVTERDGLVIMTNGNWTGVLVGDANVTRDNITLAVDDNNPAFFMAIPPEGLEADTRLDIAQGVAHGKVFGEISLVKRNDTLAQDLTLYANASEFHVDVTNTSADAVNLTVSGQGEGQALVFTVDRTTLTTSLADFNVTIDGVSMRECDNFTELEGSAASGGCFTLDANESALRVSVMPEHFSTHTISMGSVKPIASSTAASSTPTNSTSDSSSASTDTTTTTTTQDSGSTTDKTTDKTTVTSTPPTGATTTTPATTPTPATGDAKTPGIGAVGALAAVALAIAVISLRRRRT